MPDAADILTPEHDSTYESYICEMFGFIKYLCADVSGAMRHEHFILVIDDDMDHSFLIWKYATVLANPAAYNMLLIIGDECPPFSSEPSPTFMREMIRAGSEIATTIPYGTRPPLLVYS